MLLVKTKIAPSKISAIGLFADEFIPKGTHIWRFKKEFDIRVDQKYPDTLPEPAKSYFMSYAYQNPETLKYVLCADNASNARFFNHSNTPNTHCVEDPDDEDTMNIAARDIQAGEELTIDYREFDTNPLYGFEKL